MLTLTSHTLAQPTSFLQPCKWQQAERLGLSSRCHAYLQKSQSTSADRHWKQASAPTACTAQLGFHQQRLAADVSTSVRTADFKPLAVEIRSDLSFFPGQALKTHIIVVSICCRCRREARTDHELQAIGWLRARSFYAYPPERAFAGQVSSDHLPFLPESKATSSLLLIVVCAACLSTLNFDKA